MTTASANSQQLLDLLGGRRLLGTPRGGQADFIQLIREGLPHGSLDALGAALGIPSEDLRHALRLGPRSLRRRRASRLTPVQSERLVRLARVYAHAAWVLGDEPAALDWLRSPNRALENASPLSLLDTDLGAADVVEVLDRILHGVYA